MLIVHLATPPGVPTRAERYPRCSSWLLGRRPLGYRAPCMLLYGKSAGIATAHRSPYWSQHWDVTQYFCGGPGRTAMTEGSVGMPSQSTLY